MSGIQLHKTKGVNPFLTVCRRCGGESNELILVGRRDWVDTCRECGLLGYGGFDGGRCPRCKSYGPHDRRQLDEHERLPSTEPCEKCKAEIAEQRAIIAAGGVYWRCADCHAEGVIKPSPFASAVRQKHGLLNGEPCGVGFTKAEGCPACSGEKS